MAAVTSAPERAPERVPERPVEHAVALVVGVALWPLYAGWACWWCAQAPVRARFEASLAVLAVALPQNVD